MIVGAWTWRNNRVVGLTTPFTANTNRNLLIYLAQHNLIDLSLPHIRRWPAGFDPERPVTIYDFVQTFGPDSVQAEQLAGQFVREQLGYQPGRYGQEVAASLLHWAGFPVTTSAALGRDDVFSWFAYVVSDVAYLDSINAAYDFDPARIDFTYISRNEDTWLTQWLSIAGRIYLAHGRWLLFSLLTVLTLIYLIHFYQSDWSVTETVIRLFGPIYLLTWLLHALVLADYDRFAVPFDWLLVLLIACLLQRFCVPGVLSVGFRKV
jgi:hypothetical protein